MNRNLRVSAGEEGEEEEIGETGERGEGEKGGERGKAEGEEEEAGPEAWQVALHRTHSLKKTSKLEARRPGTSRNTFTNFCNISSVIFLYQKSNQKDQIRSMRIEDQIRLMNQKERRVLKKRPKKLQKIPPQN